MRVLTCVPDKTKSSWNVTLDIQDDLVLVVRPRGTPAGTIRAAAQAQEAVCRVNRLIQVPRGTSRLLNEEEKITQVSCVCLLTG